jgi:hypothetical protein
MPLQPTLAVPNGKNAVHTLHDTVKRNLAAEIRDTVDKRALRSDVPHLIEESYKHPDESREHHPDFFSPSGGQEDSSEADVKKRSYKTPGSETKNVNIHLNKSLIDNFSIIVTTATNGIDDLKGKVEEALLEVLNSANAIE